MIRWMVENLQALTMAGAVLVAGVYASTRFNRVEAEDGETRLAYPAGQWRRNLAVAGILVALAASVSYVPAGYRGVVMNAATGVEQGERGEGLSFMVPFFQRQSNIDVRTRAFSFEVVIQTKDLQEVKLPVTVNYHINAERASEVVQEVGYGFESTIILPAAFQGATQAGGLVAAEALASSRQELAQSIVEAVIPQLDSHGIETEFVAIKDAVFDTAFIESVKNKVIAEQNAQEEKTKVEVARQRADQRRLEAAGEADALVIIAEAERQRIQDLGMTAAEFVWYTKWNGALPNVLAGDQSGFILDLPDTANVALPPVPEEPEDNE